MNLSKHCSLFALQEMLCNKGIELMKILKGVL